LENLPSRSPFIICPNHVSYLDPFLLCAVLPFRIIRDFFILGYTDYFEAPLTRWLSSTVNIVPVDPNANLTRAMRIAAVGLRRDRILLVFPEGERSISGELTSFKKGAAILSIELGVPLVPVGIRGTFQAWPRGGRLRAHPVDINIGEPIDPSGFEEADDPYTSINDELRRSVARLLD
jgi:long-chain acyl-CoA synthetase